MTVNLYKTDSGYTVTVRAFDIEKNISYLTMYLSKEAAYKMANHFAAKMIKIGEIPISTIKDLFIEEREKLEEIYIDCGKGVAHIKKKNIYAVYYEYVDGPSPVMRMAFSKKEFGANKAYKLAKQFNKKLFFLKDKKKIRDQDIEKIIEEFDKLKLQNKYNNLAKKRRKILKKYRME